MTPSAPVPTGLAVLEMAQAGRFAEIRDMFAPELRAMVPAGARRGYQVTVADDLDGWKAGLAGRQDVTIP